MMLIIAATCLIALGIGAFLVLGRGPGSDDGATIQVVRDEGEQLDAEAYSFSIATNTVDLAPAMKMTVSIEAPDGNVEMSAIVDRRERRMQLELSGDVEGLGVANIRMIADERAGVIYMSGALFESDKDWISIDVNQFGDVMGPTEWFSDPVDITGLFAGVTPVDLGIESIDGEPLKHFAVTMSVADMLALDPAALDGFGDADLSALDSITFDVWVDQTSRVRRMTFGDGDLVSIDISIKHVEVPVSIPLPDPADVASLFDVLATSFEDEFGTLGD